MALGMGWAWNHQESLSDQITCISAALSPEYPQDEIFNTAGSTFWNGPDRK